MGSAVVVHRLSCSMACGIMTRLEMEPVSPAFAARFLTTGPPGKSMASAQLRLNEAICSTGLLNTIPQQKKSNQIVMRCLYFILLFGEFVASISILFGG